MNYKLLSPVLGGLALLGVAALTPAAQAGTFSYNGDLTGQSTFNRPIDGDPPTIILSFDNFPYQAQAFTVDTTGSGYSLIGRWHTTSGAPAGANPGADGFLFLYANSFNPASPLTNIISGGDDYNNPGANCSSGVSCSRLPNTTGNTLTLTAGVTYFAVASSYNGVGLGGSSIPTLYTVDINTPGAAQVNFGVPNVPEPSSILGLVGLGLLGMGFQLKKRLK